MKKQPVTVQPQEITGDDPLSWRMTLAKGVFQTMSIISLPAFLAASYYSYDQRDYTSILVYILLATFMLAVAFFNPFGDRVRMWGILAILYFIVLLDFFTEGRGSLARTFLIVFCFMGTVLFGKRGAVITMLLGGLTMVFFAFMYVDRLLPDFLVTSLTLPGWISNTVIVVVLMALIVYSVDYLVREMAAFLARSNQLNKIIEGERTNLEQRVHDRTAAAESALAEAEASASEALAARKDLELQIWLATGQTRLADTMRGEQDIPQLAGNVIAQLCQYMDAQAGALYLLENNILTLVGKYAFSARAGFNGKVRLGEGLVGQSALDGTRIYLEDIPPDAMTISTGLVKAMPRQMVISPFFVNGEVLGVLELATFSTFSAAHFELLDRTSESIGIAFRTEQTRDRLADLLTEMQSQAEEMQAQEEELRAANVELQAQAEKLTEVRYEKKQRSAS
jgi:hypothetical protein